MPQAQEEMPWNSETQEELIRCLYLIKAEVKTRVFPPRRPAAVILYPLSVFFLQVDGFFTLLFGLASINTLTVISVTRYIKGCHPSKGQIQAP